MLLKVLAGLTIASLLWPAIATAKSYQTPSGKVMCTVTPDSALPAPNPDQPFDAVVCQGQFTQPGASSTVVTTGDGTLTWSETGPIVESPSIENPLIRMVYQRNYHWSIWTIRTAPAGTKLTNSRTGHGMYVSIDNVYAF